MIKFKRIYDISGYLDKGRLNSVIGIYEKAFPYYTRYSSKISKLIKEQTNKNFEIILIVAEGNKARVLGFSLFFYFPDLNKAYLDFIVSDPPRKNRGIGAALYEVTRSILLEKKCQGLFYDVAPDDLELTKESNTLVQNQKRLAFYESFGAKPILGTLYEYSKTKINMGYPLYLVFDPLSRKNKLRAKELQDIIKKIFNIKINVSDDDKKLKNILDSVKDGEFFIRKNIYSHKEHGLNQYKLINIEVVSTDDNHQIHHLKERGYVERPARVEALKKGLSLLNIDYIKIKKYPQAILKEVHGKGLINLIKDSEKSLFNHKAIYLEVYPRKNLSKMPKDINLRAGFFALDSFTPLTGNVYKAAIASVNCALTGAEQIQKGSQLVYSICRPPGHHAEKNFYGGFCYFNNAAIAAHSLSKTGKVAFIDIDFHHGNGSQDIFYDRDDVFFISIHGDPSHAYPFFSGSESEVGLGAGKGFNKNYPLHPGCNDDQYKQILNRAIKKLIDFKPQCLVISLGLDIMKGDPTGSFLITNQGMKEIGEAFKKVKVPKLIVQEGGYSLTNLRNGIKNFLLGISAN